MIHQLVVASRSPGPSQTKLPKNFDRVRVKLSHPEMFDGLISDFPRKRMALHGQKHWNPCPRAIPKPIQAPHLAIFAILPFRLRVQPAIVEM